MFRQQQPAARKPRAKEGARQPRRYTFLQVFLAGRSPEAHGGAKEQRGADEQRAEK
jgi:hypothetical protein